MKNMKRFCLCILIMLTSQIWAQTPSPSPTATPDEKDVSVKMPVVLQEIPSSIHRYRSTVTHRELFLVASAGSYTAEERALLLGRRVEKVLEELSGGQLPPVNLEVSEQYLVLKFGDQLLATILPGDVLARHPGSEVTEALQTETAEAWRSQLEADLVEGYRLRDPLYKWYALGGLGALLLIFLLIHAKISPYLARKTSVPDALFKEVLWTFYLVLCLWSYLPARSWAESLYNAWFKPLTSLVFVILGASILVHFFQRAMDKFFPVELDAGNPTRRSRRLATLKQVTLVTGRVILYLLGFVVFISLLPINFAPLLASASVVGVAFGFAAQDTLRDLFGGLSILIEDRFGVGDWIEWNGNSGSVESFNLKSTRIRSVDGSLLIIPNADLRVVRNLSNEWSQVDYTVSVAYEGDFRFALRCLTEEATTLWELWPDRILEAPDPKGLEKLGESSVTLRIFLKTQPLAQWDVQRELNARVKERFDREGISIPYPQAAIWMKSLPHRLSPSKSIEKTP